MFSRKFALVASLLMVVSAQAGAQNPTVKVKEEKPGLLKQATVAPAAAIKRAQRVVPNGTITSAELEREDGKLIYSFDIKVRGKPGIEEVNIDARTGAVLAHEHEGPAQERAEARADRNAATAKKH